MSVHRQLFYVSDIAEGYLRASSTVHRKQWRSLFDKAGNLLKRNAAKGDVTSEAAHGLRVDMLHLQSREMNAQFPPEPCEGRTAAGVKCELKQNHGGNCRPLRKR